MTSKLTPIMKRLRGEEGMGKEVGVDVWAGETETTED